MKKLILIPLIFISISVFAQKAKIINHRFVAPGGVVIITTVIIPSEPDDTLRYLDCDTILDCDTPLGCPLSFFGKINYNPYLDNYYKHEEILII